MNHLCSNLNHTFAVLNLPKELNSIVNKNQLTGIFGSCTNKLLCKQELRRCAILAENELGKKLNNNSYSGVLGLLQDQKIDLYLKGESDLLEEDFFLKTYSIRSEKILAFHLLSDSNRSYFDLINNFNFEILLYLTYICCNLFCFFFYLILYNFKINKINLRTIKFNCFVSFFLIKKHKFNIINIFLLFMTLFYWFNQLLITSQIKTNTVVIDKSDLIINLNDLLNTKRIVCFINEEVEYKMALKLSKNNILNRLLIEKTVFYKGFEAEIRAFNSKRWDTHPPLTGFLYSPKWIILAHETTRMIFITMFSNIISDFSFWTMKQPVYQYDVVLYYNLRNKINFNFRKYSLLASESGLYKNVYSCFERNVKISTIKKVKLIDNLDEINENSKVSILRLTNYRSIFIVYFVFCFAILLIYLITFMIYRFKKLAKLKNLFKF